MKIIGKTEDGFILEASKDDVAALEGLYSHQKTFRVGDLIDVDGLFSRCKHIEMTSDDIKRLRSSLEDIIKALSWFENFRKG